MLAQTIESQPNFDNDVQFFQAATKETMGKAIGYEGPLWKK